MWRMLGLSRNGHDDEQEDDFHPAGSSNADEHQDDEVDALTSPNTSTDEQDLLQREPVRDVERWTFGTVPPQAEAFQVRQLMADLTRLMNDNSAAEPLTLSGGSGVGKTQLAAEYARGLWSAEEIDVLMWVDATCRDAVLSLFSLTSALTGSAQLPDATDVLRRWWEWLDVSGKRWLVVFDDVQDPSDLDGLWPPALTGGQVLVTTQRTDCVPPAGHCLFEVGAFSPAESKAFLRAHLSGRPSQLDGAEALAEELGHMPVSLAQASAHVADRTALTCASYRQFWLDRHLGLFSKNADGAAPSRELHKTMITTLSLSIRLANSLNPVGIALPLLELMSMMDPNGVPAVVLTTPAVLTALSEATGREVDGDSIMDALICLHRLHLIIHQSDAPNRAVRVPTFIQRTIHGVADVDHMAGRARTMADALVQVWPNVERDTELSAVLRSNARALRVHADGSLWDPSAHDVLFRLGESSGRARQVKAAVDYYSRLCEVANERLGADHPDTLQARHNLAHWRGEAGDADGMTTALEGVLVDVERVLGHDHPSALATRHNLAYSRGEAGDQAGAVAELEQVLSTQKRVLGPESAETLTTHLSYARWLGETGDAPRAAQEFEHVLTALERVLGLDHPETLTARHGLARWLGETGNAARAVAELEQVLSDQHRVLGADSLDTLTTRHNLAYWRTELGDTVGAIEELDQVLASQTRVLGPDHPDTLTTHHNLAYSRGELGAASDAATALEEVVAAQERVLGPNHPRTAISRRSLAHWRRQASTRSVS